MAAPGTHSGNSSQQVVTLLPLTLLMDLDALAKAHHTTRSALIREACQIHAAKLKGGE